MSGKCGAGCRDGAGIAGWRMSYRYYRGTTLSWWWAGLVIGGGGVFFVFFFGGGGRAPLVGPHFFCWVSLALDFICGRPYLSFDVGSGFLVAWRALPTANYIYIYIFIFPGGVRRAWVRMPTKAKQKWQISASSTSCINLCYSCCPEVLYEFFRCKYVGAGCQARTSCRCVCVRVLTDESSRRISS